MKIVTIVGARPQFIKAAVGSRILRQKYNEILVHTGQHFDANMSDVFFDELEIPRPDYNLGISGGTHGQMTGNMLIAIENLLINESPNAVLLYGDTNSTLAGALAAVKLHIPVIHVESGNRFGTLDSPEEVNRICTDHISTLCFACSQSAYESLIKENITNNSFLVGDPMLDAYIYYIDKAQGCSFLMQGLNGSTFAVPKEFYYMTCHRQENTHDINILKEILIAMNSLDAPTIYPVHPRNQNAVKELTKEIQLSNLILVEPLGYLESINLVCGAKKIVTDSGGLQREAFFAGKQCVTILDFEVWPETMVSNRNQLSRPYKNEILDKLSKNQTVDKSYRPFGNGHAAEKIADIIRQWRSNE